MIEKKISYSINIEKPSKTKPVKQGGVLNYLGKQKTVNAPVKWRSSKDHPIAHLSYITKDEEKILIDLNLYGSLKGKPNRGPFGLPSLQGSGGGAGGGDGGGSDGGSSSSDSSDSGTGQSGAQSGDNTDGNNADGTDGGPGTGGMGGPGGFGGDDSGMGVGGSEGFDSQTGPTSPANTLGQTDTFASDVAENEATAPTGITTTLNQIQNAIQNQIQKAIDNPVQTALGMVNPAYGLAYGFAKDAYSKYSRGVTAPDDYSQATESVQSGPAQSPDGGITTLPQYAPLYNQATGDPLLDSLIARYRMNPASFGVT